MNEWVVGTQVRFWTGLREGEGRTGRLSYEGVYECGGTRGVYIAAVDGRAIGFVALTHVERLVPEKAVSPEPSANGKEVKRHEFTAPMFVAPGEHILCAVIIGPDRDDPALETLHLRMLAASIEILETIPPASREMIAQHLDRLLADFRKIVAGEREPA